MGMYDVLLILSWVVVVVTLCLGACAVMAADWREQWTRLWRYAARRGRL